jgi:hypothetical protein
MWFNRARKAGHEHIYIYIYYFDSITIWQRKTVKKLDDYKCHIYNSFTEITKFQGHLFS